MSEYKNKFPNWWRGTGEEQLILSDDLDSLLSCAILKEVKNWDIQAFYDFERLYKTDLAEYGQIGVDIALEGKARCFDNHVVKIGSKDIINPNSINFNISENIYRSIYTSKYSGSTALMLWWLYGIPLPKSDTAKMFLLCPDSSFLGYYSNSKDMQNAYKKFVLNVMGYEKLYHLLGRKSISDFDMIANAHDLKSKISINDLGRLQTKLDTQFLSHVFELDLELPKRIFTPRKPMEKYCIEIDGSVYSKSAVIVDSKLFSFALTEKNCVNYTARI